MGFLGVEWEIHAISCGRYKPLVWPAPVYADLDHWLWNINLAPGSFCRGLLSSPEGVLFCLLSSIVAALFGILLMGICSLSLVYSIIYISTISQITYSIVWVIVQCFLFPFFFFCLKIFYFVPFPVVNHWRLHQLGLHITRTTDPLFLLFQSLGLGSFLWMFDFY